jgi:tetratricopeptide (TPR) repeat protein
VARTLLAAILFNVLLSAQSQLPPPPPPRPQDLPEEDESLKPKEYPLNPLESVKDVNVGKQYMVKGKYGAAAARFKEATLWDPGNAEAFQKLGEALEHMHDFGPAREAYTKYLALAKDAKDAGAIRSRMAKWPKSSALNPPSTNPHPADQ